jgi:hypothetical protein
MMEGLLQDNLNVVVVVCLVAWALVQVYWRVIDRQREEVRDHEPRANPPLHKEYVSREEFGKIEARLGSHERDCPRVGNLSAEIGRLDRKVDELAQQVDQRFEGMRRADSASREKLYNSIRTIEQNVSALQASDSIRMLQSHEMQQDIKQILGKIGGV